MAQAAKLHESSAGCAGACSRATSLRRAASLGLLLLPPALLGSSLCLSLGEAALRSDCGAACGFMLDVPRRATTPVDALLLAAAAVPPLDSALLLALLALALSGVVTSLHAPPGLLVGPWALRRRGSSAGALVRLAAFMLLASIAWCAMLPALAPTYAAHGVPGAPGGWTNGAGTGAAAGGGGEGEGCSLSKEGCRLSALASALHVLVLRIPFFGTAWYGAQWLYAVLLIVRCGARVVRRRGGGGGGEGGGRGLLGEELGASDDDGEWD